MTRLDPQPTHRILRTQELTFTFGHRRLTGLAGDTAATALFANGVRIFSRSFKYHRPRGLYSLDGESSTALMQIDRTPNVRAELTPLAQGMLIEAQNVAGSLEHDLLAAVEHFGAFLKPGFYYKTFHRPSALWPFFQERIRRMAGLGRLDPAWRAGVHDAAYLNAEVCVVGGGPAGLTAALAAADKGVRVILLESRPWLGGFYEWRTAEQEGRPLRERANDLAAQVQARPNIRVFTEATLFGLFPDNLITARLRGRPGESFTERYLEIRAGAVVVATGASERPLIFENNERPGVMQAGCAWRLARTWALKPGQEAVFSVGDDLALEAAADLADLGVRVAAVADSRPAGQGQRQVAELARRGIPFLPGWVAQAAQGRRRVQAVRLVSLDGLKSARHDCDLLVASAGLTSNHGPLALAKAEMEYDQKSGLLLPRRLPERVFAAGRLLGLAEPAAVEASGRLAGLKAAADRGQVDQAGIAAAERELAATAGAPEGCRLIQAPGRGTKRFVCFDEDVTVRDVGLAAQEGFDAVELNKRWTTAGMGPSQGGVPGLNLPLVLAEHLGLEPGALRPTTVRSPLSPTLLATYAGRNYHVSKRTPLHDSQAGLGATMRLAGVWKRARYFSADASAAAEVANVHANVGLIDVSTLGKFKIWGPDALKALQRMYVGDMATVGRGRLKYSAMLNEDGCLIDDGVVTQTGDDEYYFTTSTARAGQTIEWFRFHSRSEDWTYHLVNLTDVLGAINLTGPKARQVLERVTADDVSAAALPYLGFKEITFKGGLPAKALRVGFTGELGFELHLPASLTQAAWDLLWEAGRSFGIKPFGLEAQNLLRLEKGHLIIGPDTDLRVNLLDLRQGFLWARGKTGGGTLGAPALRRTEGQPGRLKLIGFKMAEGQPAPPDGAIIVDDEIRGHVTSARFSAQVGAAIGLALVEERLARMDGEIDIFHAGLGARRLRARVARIPFYDPEGRRVRG